MQRFSELLKITVNIRMDPATLLPLNVWMMLRAKLLRSKRIEEAQIDTEQLSKAAAAVNISETPAPSHKDDNHSTSASRRGVPTNVRHNGLG